METNTERSLGGEGESSFSAGQAPYKKPPTISDDYRAVDIYRQAAEVIYRKGFDATSMGDIADAVDLTKGGLYYYIKGKKALLFAIMNFALDLVETEVMNPARAEEVPEQRLRILLSHHARLVLQEKAAMSILVSEEEGLEAPHRAKIRHRRRILAEFVSDTIASVNRIMKPETPVDPKVAAFSILGVIHGMVHWFRSAGRLSSEEVIAQICDLVMNGLAPRYRAT